MHLRALRRPLAIGSSTAVLTIAIVGQHPPAAHADRAGDWRGSSVAAVEISESDTDIGSAANEVVAIRRHGGGVAVSKLRASTRADARRLAAELDAAPDVVAAVNSVNEPLEARGAVAGPQALASVAAKAVSTIDLPSAKVSGPLRNEALGSRQWGMRAVGAEAAWRVTRAPRILVAVIDTGVDSRHPDLAGRTLAQIDELGEGVTGDPHGHGTHVAGVVGAALNGTGVAGLSEQVSILPVRVLDETGTGDVFTIAQGIIDAVNRGANVLNVSITCLSNSSVLAEAIAYANRAGVVVVAAAGNLYKEGNAISYPAGMPGVIGVSSIDSSGRSSGFANSGSYVDVSAPGENILSTVPGGDWRAWTGTSMATPFVSATAALALAANPSLTKAQVESVVTGTAQDDPGRKGWDPQYGYGLVRADRATIRAAQLPGGLRAFSPRTPTAVKVASVWSTSLTASQARISWDAPLANGGPGITSYTVRVNQTGAMVRVAGRSANIGGLRPGAAYTFSVVAHNAIGSSPWSGASAVLVPPPPTAGVRASPVSRRGKLYVNVDPNMGPAYWKFTVQKRTSKGSWRKVKNYRTRGAGETRTINLRKGTYRVQVQGKFGYRSSVSSAVRLVR